MACICRLAAGCGPPRCCSSAGEPEGVSEDSLEREASVGAASSSELEEPDMNQRSITAEDSMPSTGVPSTVSGVSILLCCSWASTWQRLRTSGRRNRSRPVWVEAQEPWSCCREEPWCAGKGPGREARRKSGADEECDRRRRGRTTRQRCGNSLNWG